MSSLPEVITSTVPDLPCDAVVVGAFAQDGGAVLASPIPGLDETGTEQLKEAMTDAAFKAPVGSVLLIPMFGMAPARSVAIAGLGKRSTASPQHVRKAAAGAARRLADRIEIASVLHSAVEGSEDAAAQGFLLGSYRFNKYKSEPSTSKIQRVSFINASKEELRRGSILAEATTLARDLINEPPASLTPRVLAEQAREIAELRGLEFAELAEAELEERGFGGLVGVARGSAEPPRLIHLKYAPPKATQRVAIVGKAVTFDSGGLSLKGMQNMMDMKTDMAGGAAVIGTMSALPRLGAGVEVDAYVPAVENMPGGRSLRPGDVIHQYGGRTTEVLNTDAEGRLILGDALAMASEHKPDAIVDIATLTGSISIALGNKIAGLFSTSEKLAAELRDAATSCGESLWSMPLADDYSSELDSQIADCKNVGGRMGGAIIAALFLKAFVQHGIPWAHLDIAGAARSDKDYDEISKGGTGIGTRTLIGWIERRAASAGR
jgi:leucyl aminopeptidase